MALFVPFLLYMRKNVFGRKFKRDTGERSALFKGLLSALVLEERIKTTEQKAKAIKAEADKLVTKAKKGSTGERLFSEFLTPNAIGKMVKEIAPGFKDRNGGYTRIVKLPKRFSDNADMVIMEWVERVEVLKPKIVKKSPAKSKKLKNSDKKTVKRSSLAAKAKSPAKKTKTKEKK